MNDLSNLIHLAIEPVASKAPKKAPSLAVPRAINSCDGFISSSVCSASFLATAMLLMRFQYIVPEVHDEHISVTLPLNIT